MSDSTLTPEAVIPPPSGEADPLPTDPASAGEAPRNAHGMTPEEAQAYDAAVREGKVPGSAILNVGWLGTTMALNLLDLPLQFVLKDQLHYSAAQVAAFGLIGKTASYVKPVMGVLSDAVPLGGTRRYHYLQLSLLMAAVFSILLGLAPRHFAPWMLTIYVLLYLWMNLASTVLGGLMVDLGKQYHATGRLSSQRQAITRGTEMMWVVGGYLAKVDFLVTGVLCSLLYVVLMPVMKLFLKEPLPARTDFGVLREVKKQGKALISSRPLLAAAGLIILVVAAPGFKTPLLYFQTDVLGFSKPFVGTLKLLGAISSIVAALLYSKLCRKFTLRRLLAASILFHALMTLWYLLYQSPVSAMVITCLEAATMVWAILPLYDLAARATPKGSEALGYSVMMSVWNFTLEMADVAGSWLTTSVAKGGMGLHFHNLVWINAATTLLVLVAVPFLPGVLVDHRDGAVVDHGH